VEDPCAAEANRCQHFCLNQGNGRAKCQCYPGFRLAEDQLSCIGHSNKLALALEPRNLPTFQTLMNAKNRATCVPSAAPIRLAAIAAFAPRDFSSATMDTAVSLQVLLIRKYPPKNVKNSASVFPSPLSVCACFCAAEFANRFQCRLRRLSRRPFSRLLPRRPLAIFSWISRHRIPPLGVTHRRVAAQPNGSKPEALPRAGGRRMKMKKKRRKWRKQV
jgi:hypothetical protein